MMGSKATEPKLFLSFDLDSQVPRRHILRRLAEAVDLGFVRELGKAYYSHTGQPSVDPVVLFKLSLLGYLFGMLSERRLCEEAGLNLAWRWFLGYELDEEIPDHSVLSKARRRFGVKVYEQFFVRVVKLCQERGLIQGKVLFLDSTQVAADASMKSLSSRSLQRQLGSSRAGSTSTAGPQGPLRSRWRASTGHHSGRSASGRRRRRAGQRGDPGSSPGGGGLGSQ